MEIKELTITQEPHSDWTYIEANYGDKLVGRVTLCWQELDDQYYIQGLLVIEECRRMGIGRLLVQKCIELAGNKRITLGCYMDNLPARALYRSLGFVGSKSSTYMERI